MIGNDGGAYISVTNKNGICRWVPYNKPSFESRLLSPVLPPHSALPQRQILQQVEKKPAPRSVACHAMKAVDLKKILSDAQVAGRSKLTTKEAMCDEIMRLGLL